MARDTDTLARSLHDLGLAAWFGGSLAGPAAPAPWAAIGTHLVGSVWLTVTNAGRLRRQPAAARVALVKGVVTAAAVGATVWSRRRAGEELGEEGPEAMAEGPRWVVPALTGALVVLGARMGEQQRPTELLRTLAAKVDVRDLASRVDLHDLPARVQELPAKVSERAQRLVSDAEDVPARVTQQVQRLAESVRPG